MQKKVLVCEVKGIELIIYVIIM